MNIGVVFNTCKLNGKVVFSVGTGQAAREKIGIVFLSFKKL
jgi:hypothetical protein